MTSFDFYGWTSLGVSLSEAYPTQNCYNLRARHLEFGHPQDLQCYQCWVELRGLFCPLWTGIDMM